MQEQSTEAGPAPRRRRFRRGQSQDAPLGRDLKDLDPTWRKAPFLLLRYPGILLSIAAAAAILAVTSAAGPLFVASAESETIASLVGEQSRWDTGLDVVVYGRFEGTVTADSDVTAIDAIEQRDAFLQGLVEGTPGVGARVLTEVGSEATITTAAGSSELPGRLVSRTGFLDHVQVVDSAGGSGVWVPDDAAEELGVAPGDSVVIGVRGLEAESRVAGVYASTSMAADADYWSPLERYRNADQTDGIPPALVLTDPSTVATIGAQLDEVAQFTWSFPLEPGTDSLEEARAIAARFRSVSLRIDDATDDQVELLFAGATSATTLPGVISVAGDVVASVRGPIDAVTLAARLLALAVLASVGVSAARRRRSELDLLSARGVAAGSLGARSAVEAILPIAAGTVVGWLLGRWLVDAFGPGAVGDPQAIRASMGQAVLGAAAGAALLGLVTGLMAREEHEEAEPGRLRGFLVRAPWEVVVLLLAGAALYEITTRGADAVADRTGVARIDVLLLAFPLLFIAGLAGLVVRGLGRALPALRAVGGQRSGARFLAARRVAGATRLALLLVTASAVAAGILVYAGTLAGSTRASADAKAHVLVGSDVRVDLRTGPTPALDGLAFPATVVTRIPGALILPSESRTEFIAVDVTTLPDAAFWDDRFADRTLEALIEPLARIDGERLPVLAVGTSLATTGTIELPSGPIPIRRVGAPVAFPGMPAEGPLLVADRATLDTVLESQGSPPLGSSARSELWARGDPRSIVNALERRAVPIEEVVTVDEVTLGLSFVAVSWVFELLQALGIVAALITVVGTILYLQARQRAREVSYALAASMGLPRGTHFLAGFLEVGTMLAAALVIGAVLAVGAALLVHGKVDVLPGLPPDPVLRVPLGLIAVALAFVAALSAVAAWAVQRGADRARVSEVLRVAA
jgi:putative ABC transport system permease protein